MSTWTKKIRDLPAKYAEAVETSDDTTLDTTTKDSVTKGTFTEKTRKRKGKHTNNPFVQEKDPKGNDRDDPTEHEETLIKNAMASAMSFLQNQVIGTLEKAARKDHWRRLPPNSKGRGKQGEESTGKTWVDYKEPYHKQVVKAAPAIAAKSLTDLPRGTSEKLLEDKLLGKKVSATGAFKRGAGRYGGAMLGIATAPIFLSGMKDLKNAKTDKDRKRGYAKVIGSGAAYQAVKGATEYSVEKGTQHAVRGGLSRMAVNLPSTALLAAGIAKGSKEKDPRKKYLYGAAGGLAGGVLKGAGEAGLHLPKGTTRAEAIKRLRAKGIARGLGGVASGLVLTAIVDKLMKEKKGSAGRDATIWGASGATAAGLLTPGSPKKKLLAAGIGGLTSGTAAYLTGKKVRKKKEKVAYLGRTGKALYGTVKAGRGASTSTRAEATARLSKTQDDLQAFMAKHKKEQATEATRKAKTKARVIARQDSTARRAVTGKGITKEKPTMPTPGVNPQSKTVSRVNTSGATQRTPRGLQRRE